MMVRLLARPGSMFSSPSMLDTTLTTRKQVAGLPISLIGPLTKSAACAIPICCSSAYMDSRPLPVQNLLEPGIQLRYGLPDVGIGLSLVGGELREVVAGHIVPGAAYLLYQGVDACDHRCELLYNLRNRGAPIGVGDDDLLRLCRRKGGD